MATAKTEEIIVLTLTKKEAEDLHNFMDENSPSDEHEESYESIKDALYPMF